MTEVAVVLMGITFIVLLFSDPCTAVGLLLAGVIVSRVMKK